MINIVCLIKITFLELSYVCGLKFHIKLSKISVKCYSICFWDLLGRAPASTLESTCTWGDWGEASCVCFIGCQNKHCLKSRTAHSRGLTHG